MRMTCQFKMGDNVKVVNPVTGIVLAMGIVVNQYRVFRKEDYNFEIRIDHYWVYDTGLPASSMWKDTYVRHNADVAL